MLAFDVADLPAPHTTDPQESRIRRAWWFLVGSFTALGAISLLDVLVDGPPVLHAVVAVLVAVSAAAALLHRQAVRALEVHRRGEVESFARILQGLSRSVSADAIVEAIVEDLGAMTGADHIVVVRLRPNTTILEATLVSSRHGVPASTTILPISDLDEPVDAAADGSAVALTPVAVGPGPFDDAAIVADGASVVHLASSNAAGARRGEDGQGRIVVGGSAGASRRAATQRVAERLAQRARIVYGLKNTMVAPLETSTGVVGAIVLSRRTADPWPPAAERLLTGAAIEVSAALARAYSHQAAEARASTDALTGLPNRRYFEEVCGLFARRRRSDDSVGILMIDIDRFKALNDRHGHAVGDQVLREVAGAIVSAVREDDVPARYGGEEFVVLLRNPAPGVAADVGERVRSAVRSLDLSRHGVAEVSVSVGVAVASSADEPIVDMIVQADHALYRAKRAGRDRVVAA